jgi:hypothetical protein
MNVFKQILELSILQNEEIHRSMSEVSYVMDSPSNRFYVENYRTLRLNIGQRVGYTTAVLELASPTDDIIVTAHADTRNFYLDQMAYAVTKEEFSKFKDERRSGAARIFVDDATSILQEPEDYDIVYGKYPRRDQMFILLH